MHVTGLSEFDGVGPGVPMHVPSRADDPSAQVFGDLAVGSMTGIDAARIEPRPGNRLDADIIEIGGVSGWRPVVFPADVGTPVRMFGAQSGHVLGTIRHPIATIPEESLDAAILTDIDTDEGDSGAALVDPQGFVLGFLVGQFQSSGLSAFCAAGLVLERLSCDIP